MSSGWIRPKPRTYEYNYQIQSNYYRPAIDSLDKSKKESLAKTYAERIKTYPLYGGKYPDHADEKVIEGRRSSVPFLDGGRRSRFYLPRSTAGLRGSSLPRDGPYWDEDTEEALRVAKARLAELEEIEMPKREPLWKKHPYYVPLESEVTAPHEGSVWPESRPHFHLVSSYDLMVGYLGLKGQARTDAAQRDC